MEENLPLVSIACITYNHGKYIAQALDGFFAQETTFPIEILIHDDASTDNTVEIIKEYERKHPGIIKPIYQTENQFSKGVSISTTYNFPRAKGKYIALCEGDDYWIDPKKLQKQVDFLESNDSYSFCFHDAFILNQRSNLSNKRIGDKKIDFEPDARSIIVENNISTASLMFRNTINWLDVPFWFIKTIKRDYGICLLVSEKGIGKYFSETMSVYRVHDGGVWNGKDNDFKYEEDIRFYIDLKSYFTGFENERCIDDKIRFVEFNWGINLIRRGNYQKGLLKIIRNYRVKVDKRFKMKLTRIPGALKESFIHLK